MVELEVGPGFTPGEDPQSNQLLHKSLVFSLLLTTLLLTTGCSTPFLSLAGKSLQGIESQAESWAFAKDYKILQLETRPEDPYSVYLRVLLRNDQLYIDAAKQRRWHEHIKKDPSVRIKLGKKIYRAHAIEVTDPQELEGFISGRTIYRLTMKCRMKCGT